jgi:hypothetical protein
VKLLHFSDDPAITMFEPRPVRVPPTRSPGREWLNGPLVWATDEPHAILYLFPRGCPRVVVWPTPHTTAEDRATWMGPTPARAVAYVEAAWMGCLRSATVHRYALPPASFEDTGDTGMWVSRVAVRPMSVEALDALDARLSAAGVELRALKRLAPLKPLWSSTLHASGIRLRNVVGWV